jgi:hypothetical protein
MGIAKLLAAPAAPGVAQVHPGTNVTVTGTLANPVVNATEPAPATTVTGPDTYGAPAVVGVDTTFAREDHDHGLPAAPTVPTASATVDGPDAFGDAANAGTAATWSKGDHKHGLPAAPAVPAVATTVAGPAAYGAAAVVGTGVAYARNDHNHGLPAAPAPANGYGITGNTGLTPTPAVGLTSSGAEISTNVNLNNTGGVTTIIDTPSLAVGVWLLTFTATIVFGVAGSNTALAQCILAITADTATATFAGVPSCRMTPGVVATNLGLASTLSVIATVTVAGTVKLTGAYTDTTLGAVAFNNATGYTAVRIA